MCVIKAFLNRFLLCFLASVFLVAEISASPKEVVIQEAFFTQQNELNNVDSPAVWHSPDGESWLISTAKGTHRLLVDNAANGYRMFTYGQEGAGLGEFRRPNGIFVIDDLLFVVERDNRRVQVIALPEWTPLVTFGEAELKYPYGLYVQADRDTPDSYTVYVSDSYALPNKEIPPLSELGERIKCYRLTVKRREVDGIKVRWKQSFGDTKGKGVLRVVESIHGDMAYDRLLIAEEDEGAEGRVIKVYNFEGTFTGKLIGKGLFQAQTEGIALVEDGERKGYWVVADQDGVKNRFLVFKRESLEYVGAFSGEQTRNTDGVWFDPHPVNTSFPRGLFYVVNNDKGVAAISWGEVEKALGLGEEGLEE